MTDLVPCESEISHACSTRCTCTDNDARSRDASTVMWRSSHDAIIGEMIAVSDPDGTVLVTVWDCVGFFAGGEYGCDGSREKITRPLPRYKLSWKVN